MLLYHKDWEFLLDNIAWHAACFLLLAVFFVCNVSDLLALYLYCIVFCEAVCNTGFQMRQLCIQLVSCFRLRRKLLF